MGEGSPQRRKALLALLPLAVVGLLYAASRLAPPEAPPAPAPARRRGAIRGRRTPIGAGQDAWTGS